MKIEKYVNEYRLPKVNEINHGKLRSMYEDNIRCTRAYYKWGNTYGLDIWYYNTNENNVQQIQYFL